MHRRVTQRRAATTTVILGAIGIIGVIALVGCGSDDDGQGVNDGGNGDGASDAGRADAFVPGNCNALVKPTGQARKITHIPASEDFGFDNEGFLIGVSLDNGALVRTAYTAGPPEILVPGVSSQNFARGTRQLPGGDIVIAVPERNVVERYASNGSSTPLAQINDPNGIVIGDDGFIYVTAGSGSVTRLDPDSGQQTPIHSAQTSFDGITLSPDGKTLYFDQEEGNVLEVEIDENGAVGVPQPVTQIQVEFLLDGMTADACGNLYIVEMAGKIWRYSTTGVLEEWVSASQLTPPPQLIPAVNFGSGIGGGKTPRSTSWTSAAASTRSTSAWSAARQPTARAAL